MIDVSNLTICYGKKRAVDRFNLRIKKGESILLAGANGSGKTTLLRTIQGLLRTPRGAVTIDGKPVNFRSRAITAYIPASISFYDGLRISEAIRLHGSFYRDFKYKKFAEFSIEENRRVGSLSKGEKTLFILSLALSTDPDYLLIDDVIHFLDPHLREIFLKSILQLIEERGLAVVVAAQSSFDIEGILERVVILEKGKLVLDESVEKLKASCVKIYSDQPPEKPPVIFSQTWGDMKELYLYPYSEKMKPADEVHFLTLAEIVRAFIGGEYVES